EIDHHAGVGIDRAAHAHLEPVVMAVAALFVALSVCFAAPGLVAVRLVQPMSRGERESCGDDHSRFIMNEQLTIVCHNGVFVLPEAVYKSLASFARNDFIYIREDED